VAQSTPLEGRAHIGPLLFSLLLHGDREGQDLHGLEKCWERTWPVFSKNSGEWRSALQLNLTGLSSKCGNGESGCGI